YSEGVPWLILFDALTMALTNWLIALASKRLWKNLARGTWIFGSLQVAGLGIILLVLVVDSENRRMVWWMSTVVYGIGAAGMTIVVLGLIWAIHRELVRR